MSIVFPFILQNGQVADANQVMADFNAIKAVVDALGSSATKVRVIAAGATIPVLVTDGTLVVRKAAPSPTTFQLPAQSAFPLCGSAGDCPTFSFKDGNGEASANPITLSALDGALFDGQATFVINFNYAEITVFADGTNWNIK